VEKGRLLHNNDAKTTFVRNTKKYTSFKANT
jgi:hypothetical protein